MNLNFQETPLKKSIIQISESEQISNNSKDTEIDSKFQTATRKSQPVNRASPEAKRKNSLQITRNSTNLSNSFYIPAIKPKQSTFFNQLQDFGDKFQFNITNFVNQSLTFTERLSCHCDPNLSEIQSCSLANKWLFNAYQNSSELRKHYLTLLKSVPETIKKETVDQINKDLKRTCPTYKYFQLDSTLLKLKNVLQVFSIIDNEVGYVQGINFIAAALLYHAEEYSAF